MEFDDDIVFFEGEVTPLEIRPEIVNPTKTAAFAAAEKTGGSRKRAPTAFAVRFDVRDELIVFFFSPSSFVRVVLLAARRPPHLLLLLLLVPVTMKLGLYGEMMFKRERGWGKVSKALKCF